MAASFLVIWRAAQIQGDPLDPHFDYRASEAANTYSSNGGVYDASRFNNANMVPPATASRPALNTGGAGGQDYFTFDGLDDRLNLRGWGYANLTGPQGLTISAVGRVDTTVAFARRILAHISTNSAGASRLAIGVEADGRLFAEGRRLDADTVVQALGRVADDQVHHFTATLDYANAQLRFYLDGVLEATASITAGAAPTSDPISGNMGSTGSPSLWWLGDGYEIVGYSYPFDDARAAAVFDDRNVYGIVPTAPGVALDLTADGTSTSAGDAAIDVRAPLPLTATGSVTSTGSAAIGIGRPLAAAGLATSTGSAAISIGKSLSASGSAASTGSAAIAVTRPLAATGLAGSSGSAAIGVTRPVNATGSATSSGSAAITRSQALTAAGAATSSGSATVSRQITLSASATTLSEGSAQTVGDVPLSGFGTSATSGSAAIVVRRPVSATGSATSSGSAAIGAARPVTASGSAASSGSATLRVRHALVADGTSLTVGDVEVGLALTFTGDGTSGTSGSAAITLGGLPQRQPGTITLHAVPLGVAVLVPRPLAAVSLVVAPAATAILVARPAGTATLTTED